MSMIPNQPFHCTNRGGAKERINLSEINPKVPKWKKILLEKLQEFRQSQISILPNESNENSSLQKMAFLQGVRGFQRVVNSLLKYNFL